VDAQGAGEAAGQPEAIEAPWRAFATSCAAWASAKSPRAASASMVMEELRHLDEVGYVRFASVYRSFQDIEAFRTEIDQLRRHKPRREPARINCRCCRANERDDGRKK
jgi:transcriptional repressor NrdR